MPRQLTQDERDELTPAELDAIMHAPPEPGEEAPAAAAAPAVAATVEEGEGAPALTDADIRHDEGKPADDDTDPAALAALLEEEGAAPAQAALPTYDTGNVDYAAKTAELGAKKGAALKQLMDGEIDAEAYAAIDAEVTSAQVQLTSAHTLAEVNRQNALAAQKAQLDELQGHIRGLMSASQGTAIDYSKDTAAQALFDNSLKLVGSDPANAKMTAKDAVAAAHRMVKAYRGIVDAPAAAAPSPAPAPAARAVPPTLGNVPAAAPNNVSADLRAQFAMLSGDEAEEFLERLPKAQRQALTTGGALV